MYSCHFQKWIILFLININFDVQIIFIYQSMNNYYLDKHLIQLSKTDYIVLIIQDKHFINI